ncbi:MAG TPA: SMP-30/gluconolactonase/LRE family protein [Microbacteriaceae bacterium]|nr:SMP-30/gluconolactonase/LRE family protein [Microbacteriaceae bacterium]
MTGLQLSERLHHLIDPSAEFELLGEGYVFSEGPAWNDHTAELIFHDIPGDARWRWTEARGVELVESPDFKGNGAVFEPDGSLLVCEQVTSSVVRIRPDGAREIPAFHFEGKYLNSPNDVVTHSDGSIYFTDPNYGRWPVAVGVGRECELDFQGVFRVPPGGGPVQLVVERDEFEQPNGLCFSPDERVMYINDRTNLKAFDVADDGSLVNGRTIHEDMGSVDIPGTGNPDGMKTDELGNVWCTARDGIWIFAPDGALLGIVPVPEVSGNLVWGGPELRTLFVTMTTSLYRIETLVRSCPLPYHRPDRWAA